MPPLSDARQGLTVIECAVALALLGTALLLAAPLAPRTISPAERSAARVQEELDAARRAASRTGRHLRTEIDLVTGTLTTWSTSPVGRDSLLESVAILEPGARLDQEPPGEVARFRMDPYGAIRGPDIRVVGPDGREVRLSVHRWNGRLHVAR